MELTERQDKLDWIEIALSIYRGENNGKYMLEFNPEYVREVRKVTDELSKFKESTK